MHLIIMILTALLLIPAAVAGILSGASQLIGGWTELSSQIQEVAVIAEPLWTLGQSLLGVLTGLILLVLAAALLMHALKSRP
ncbi:MAG: hypothetical protein ACXIUM_07090 [Wenzhouxiangella sp.]